MNILSMAKEVFEIESKEIANLSNLVTEDFEKAIVGEYTGEDDIIRLKEYIKLWIKYHL